MRGTAKKLLTFVLAITMLISSVNFGTTIAQAGENEGNTTKVATDATNVDASGDATPALVTKKVEGNLPPEPMEPKTISGDAIEENTIAEDTVAMIGTVQYQTLAKAIEDANLTSGAVIDIIKDCEITGIVELTSPMTIQSSNGSTVVVKGGSYGFRIGKGAAGEYTFDSLTIKTAENLSCISVQPYAIENKATVNVKNCSLINTKKTCIDVEGTTGGKTDTSYFDLNVDSCYFEAAYYGIGCGLDNNKPKMNNSSLTVQNSTFGSSYIGIHVPNTTGYNSLVINNNTFSGSTQAGLKYYITNTYNQYMDIENNTFAVPGCAIQAYSFMTNASLLASYPFGNKFVNNNLCGQTVDYVGQGKSESGLETIWFPEGNILDGDTLIYQYSWPTSGYQFSAKTVLTGFGYETDSINLEVGGASETTLYHFNNGQTGSYADLDLSAFGIKFGDGMLNSYNATNTLFNLKAENDAITRWFIETEDGTRVALAEAENGIAEVSVNNLTGEITVSPIANGTLNLIAQVGYGEDGTIANGREFSLPITVRTRANVTINRYDQDGALLETTTLDKNTEGNTFYVGDSYDVSGMTAYDGYDLERIDGATSGTLDENKIINLYYTKQETITDGGDDPEPGSGETNTPPTEGDDNDPTTPGEETTDPTTPSGETTDPTTPGEETTDPTTPDGGTTNPTTPDGGTTTDPTTPTGGTTNTTIPTVNTTTPVTTAITTVAAPTAPTIATTTPVSATNNTPTTDNDTTTINDQGTAASDSVPSDNTTTIDDEDSAAAAGVDAAWALINLICAVLSAVLAILLLFSKHEKDEDQDENEEKNENEQQDAEAEDEKKRRRWTKVAGVIEGVVAIIAFILTEDMRLPMIMVDQWTLIMVIITVISIVTFIIGRKWKKETETEE